MLTAAGKTTEVRVRGSVKSNYRTAYDILVRPRQSRLPLEKRLGLVRNNYLSGLFGGITVEQWRRIESLPGVSVAAPVANIGFVLPHSYGVVSMNDVLTDDAVQLYRIRYTAVAHDGTSRYPLNTDYVYYTRNGRFAPVTSDANLGYQELVGRRDEAVTVCPRHPLASASGPFSPYAWRLCYSARSPGRGSDENAPGRILSSTGIAFPILISAIDPVQEAKLLNLKKTVVSGRYFRRDEGPRLQLLPRDRDVPYKTYHRLVPVLASTRTYVDEHVEARVERLTIPARTDVPRVLASPRGDAFLSALRGHDVAVRAIRASRIYDSVASGGWGTTPGSKALSMSYWTASPTKYRLMRHAHLAPEVVDNPLSVWRATPVPGQTLAYQQQIPPANRDVQFRRLHPRIGSIYFNSYEVPGARVFQTPVMNIVGRYDPEKLPGFSPLSQVPLETYYPPELLPADAASKDALHGKPLLPSENIGDYVAQPPLFLTTIQGMQPFLNSRYYAGASNKAPISVIRVRVKGVAGPDSLSQARIRLVATEIHDRTGLQVDITAGSSPRTLLVRLPKGNFGRPPLLLKEGWSKKGVSLSFLKALDRKRLGLLSLVLVSCLFFLANGAFASVRGRRTEIGTLLCLGWPRRSIFAVVLAELLFVSLLAGLVGAALAYAAATAIGLDITLLRALLVVPLAVCLALLAGVIPAWRAAQAVPLDAVRPAVAVGRVRQRVRGYASLALSNVRRMPARSLVGVGALFIGVAALTLLLAVNEAFQGELVGTLLGNAISFQVRGLDFLAVALIVLLACLSLADVLYLNLRERAAELMTLRTVGWSDAELGRVIAGEALALGLLGSVPGALLGLLIGKQLGVGTAALALGALAGVVGGLLVALLASLLPLARLRSLTAPAVLAEE